jgi:queuine tRNA-ribosyltransferase
MPVGTAASVKGVEPRHLREANCRVVLCNTYHLVLRPGDTVIARLGGLQRFMGWDGPILTDSGGFQVFSLADLTEVDADGVTFKSHLDGRTLRLTPERAMEIQINLGSDIMMVFDECLPHESGRDLVQRSVVERTLPWARRCLDLRPGDGRALFAIGQGGLHADIRRECLEALVELPYDGFALGGLSVGESKEMMRAMIAASTAVIPEGRPRYLMGVGSPLEILDAVALGVDLFDCVLPTRNARNAGAMTSRGPLRLKNARFADDAAVLEAGCPCPACSTGLSRAYLRHLLMAKEILGSVLMSVHNLTFIQRHMSAIRTAIENGTFDQLGAEVRAVWGGQD